MTLRGRFRREYAGLHQPMTVDGGAAPLSAMDSNGMTTIYDRATQMQHWGTGDARLDRESFAVINAVRGRPDAEITVYRAVPPGADAIHPGDWVSVSRAYAREHLLGWLEGRGRVLTRRVRVGDLYGSGDSINEYGWFPS